MNEADGAGRKRKGDSSEGSSSGVASKALNKGDDSARIKQELEGSGKGSALGYVEPLQLHISTTFDITNGIGFGGIIIDKNGKWMKGYMGNYGFESNLLELELQAIYHGLVLLTGMGYNGTKVYLPGDAAKEILKRYEDDYIDKKLFRDCNELWHATSSSLCTEKPSNIAYSKAAEWMAEAGARQDKEYETVYLPPCGMTYVRISGSSFLVSLPHEDPKGD